MDSFSQSQASGDVTSCNSKISKLPNSPLLPQTRKKNVSFSMNVRVKCTLHLDDYTDEETQSTWYTDDEMESIHEEVDRTVELMEDNGEVLCYYTMVQNEDSVNNIMYCTRGLEVYSIPELMQQRLTNKIASYDAVFNEQCRQEYQGIVDSEEISKVYQVVSSHCQVAASLMGAIDENTVAAYHRHDVSPRSHFLSRTQQGSSSSSPSQQLNKHQICRQTLNCNDLVHEKKENKGTNVDWKRVTTCPFS